MSKCKLVLLFIVSCVYSQTNETNTMKRLKKKEVKEILIKLEGCENNSILRETSFNLLPDEKVYILSDGSILLKLERGDGVLYPSKKYLVDILSGDTFEEYPVPDECFLEDIPLHIQKLADRVGLSLTLNDCLDDLYKLDEVLHRIDLINLSEEEYLLPLTAYCGQIIVNETSGIWEVFREGDGPPQVRIKGKGGKVYDFYVHVMHELNECADNFSFQAIIEMVIDPPFKLELYKPED